MKPLLLVLALFALALVAALYFALARPAAEPAVAAMESSSGPDLARLRQEVASLQSRIDTLESERRLDPGVPRAVAAAPADLPSGRAELPRNDPRWYLEQYALSCADGGEGSEYFRLAVDAYVVDLVGPICEIVHESAQPAVLRASLAQMLGRPRFGGDRDVLDALLAALRDNSAEAVQIRALQALAGIGDSAALPALEGLLFGLGSKSARETGLEVVLKLAGENTNAALLRLFLRAPDGEWRQVLIRLLDGSNLDAALDLFVRAFSMDQPVRLAAAQKIANYPGPEFQEVVADWVRVETDEAVIQALRGAQKQQSTIPKWHAMKATGPPDADPRHDDPNAWASAQADMGMQWLELTYAVPMRANAVRVFEVDSPGAVAEVRARDGSGNWVTLWRGSASSNPTGPLLIEFALTPAAVRTVRLVLDTSRAGGWNEIDAVELIGPTGGQWAQHASASSTYGSGVQNALGGEGSLLRRDTEVLRALKR